MALVRFITHPEVAIDPTIPVPEWSLSPLGLQRMAAATERDWMRAIRHLFVSAERKALDAAELIAARLNLSPIVIDELGENDRSATGYLARDAFEATADQFFAQPGRSVRGWERAVDAQARIVSAVERALASVRSDGDVAVVSHGALGALYLCHLKGVAIDRAQDQPGSGGGNVYTFDLSTRALVHDWRPIETA